LPFSSTTQKPSDKPSLQPTDVIHLVTISTVLV